MDNTILFKNLSDLKKSNYESRLFHEDMDVRLKWANHVGIRPSQSHYAQGLNDSDIAIRVAWIRRFDLEPSPEQYQEGLSSEDAAVRLAWSLRTDILPSPEQYEAGLSDECKTVAFAWTARKNIKVKMSEPNELTNLMRRPNEQNLFDPTLKYPITTSYQQVIDRFMATNPNPTDGVNSGMMIPFLQVTDVILARWNILGLELYGHDFGCCLVGIPLDKRAPFQANEDDYIDIMEVEKGKTNRFSRVKLE